MANEYLLRKRYFTRISLSFDFNITTDQDKMRYAEEGHAQ
jgi:hypothetical protein